MADNHMTSQVEAQGFELKQSKSGSQGTRKYDSPQQIVVALVSLKGALIANGFTAVDEKIKGENVICTFENGKQTIVTTQDVAGLEITVKFS